jgi:hypothetical protein
MFYLYLSLTFKSCYYLCFFFFFLTLFRYKLIVAEALVEKFTPIRQEIIKLMDSPEYLSKVLQEGQKKAHLIALETWQEVASKIGTIPNNIIENQFLKNKN